MTQRSHCNSTAKINKLRTTRFCKLEHVTDYPMSTSEANNKVLFIGGGRGSDMYVRALQAGGFECEMTPTAESGMARLREASDAFDLVVWDTESQVWALDDAFDKGRYRASMPTLLLLERLYPWVANPNS